MSDRSDDTVFQLIRDTWGKGWNPGGWAVAIMMALGLVAFWLWAAWELWSWGSKLYGLDEPLRTILGGLAGLTLGSVYWAWRSEKAITALQRRLGELERRVTQNDIDAVALMRSARFD